MIRSNACLVAKRQASLVLLVVLATSGCDKGDERASPTQSTPAQPSPTAISPAAKAYLDALLDIMEEYLHPQAHRRLGELSDRGLCSGWSGPDPPGYSRVHRRRAETPQRLRKPLRCPWWGYWYRA